MKRVLSILQSCVLFALIAGTVEAGDEFMKKWKIVDAEHSILLECDDQYQHCKGPLIERNDCYQRMREAMKAMDLIVGNRVGMESKVNDRSIFEKWDSTMKECVQ